MKSRSSRFGPIVAVLALLAVVVTLEAPWRGASERAAAEEMGDPRGGTEKPLPSRCGNGLS